MKPFIMRADQLGEGAVDFRYLLDAPAGKHGFVKAKDGHFYFDNGKRIRFFGVNITSGAAMPDKKAAPLIAERLARSGINMVRFHHVDSFHTGAQNTLIDYSKGDSQSLNLENMDRFDFLFNELKQRGVYVHIDLFTWRSYQPGDDLDYEDSLLGTLKHINFYNRRLIELHKKFIKQYLTHKNPYTGLRYADDPAVAVVEILNENSIFWHNGDIDFSSYIKDLDTLWNEWLLKKYGSREALDRAWTNDKGDKGLGTQEDPAANSVQRPPVGIWGENKLSRRASYSDLEGAARFSEHVEFLSEVEIGYFTEMKNYLRELGVKCPINYSNLPGGIGELYCLAQGEVVENNIYWNHPRGGFRIPVEFHKKEMYATDPRYEEGAFEKNMVSKIAAGKVEGKPYMVTEWNACYPTKFRPDTILMLSSYAAFQDWDGLLLFTYTGRAEEDFFTSEKIGGFFSSHNDPAIWGLAGVASAIFQEGLINPSEHLIDMGYTYLDHLTTPGSWMIPFNVVPFLSRVQARFLENGKYEGNADMVISSGFTPTGDYTDAQHAWVYARNPYVDPNQKEQGKENFLQNYQQESAVDEVKVREGNPVGTIGEKYCVLTQEQVVDKDPEAYTELFKQCVEKWNLTGKGGINPGKGEFVADTGELLYGFKEGRFIMKSDKLVSYTGNVNGSIQVGDYQFELNNHKASITLLSRDDKALGDSKHILVAAVGDCENSNMVWDGNTLMDGGTAPILIDQITGKVFLPSKYKECKAYALDAEGKHQQEMAVNKKERGFEIELKPQGSAIYFEVVFEA